MVVGSLLVKLHRCIPNAHVKKVLAQAVRSVIRVTYPSGLLTLDTILTVQRPVSEIVSESYLKFGIEALLHVYDEE